MRCEAAADQEWMNENGNGKKSQQTKKKTKITIGRKKNSGKWFPRDAQNSCSTGRMSFGAIHYVDFVCLAILKLSFLCDAETNGKASFFSVKCNNTIPVERNNLVRLCRQNAVVDKIGIPQN